MSIEAPVLVIAYNRPNQIRGLIHSLKLAQPKQVFFAIDGPLQNSEDEALVREVIEEIALIDWECNVSLKHDGIHRGLRRSVEEAVTWAFEHSDRLIVLEDDTRPTVAFFDFMNRSLETFADDQTIGHISGYNKVPKRALTNPRDPFRKSRYPESFAWGTWKRAWEMYSSDLTNWSSATVKQIGKFTVSPLAALCWSLNIKDANDEVISTWAYRWALSMWANDLKCVTPNANLVSSTGAKHGTHTRTKPTWREIPTSEVEGFASIGHFHVEIDDAADLWLEKVTMRATPLGVVRRYLESLGLRLIALLRETK